MSYDSPNEEHYKKYCKINRLVLSLLAEAYTVRNSYKTSHLFSQEQVTIAVKNNEFEAENYDKSRESQGRDYAQSRFELRSKRMRGKDIEEEFTKGWETRWEKALKSFEAAQRHYNRELARLYSEGKNAYPCLYTSLTSFLVQYQNCIFTKEQLIELLTMLGVHNPKGKFKYHKEHYGIDLFTFEDVLYVLKEMRRATEQFFYGSNLSLLSSASKLTDAVNIRIIA